LNFENNFSIELKFNTLKILKNNKIILVEPNTNNLVVLNRKFQEILTLKGIKGDSFRKIFFDFFLENEAIRDSRCLYEGSYFFWFKGGPYVSIVDTKNFKFKDLKMLKSKKKTKIPLQNFPIPKPSKLLYKNFKKKNQFLTQKIEGTLPITISVSKRLDRIMVLSVDDYNFDLYLNFWKNGKHNYLPLTSISKKISVAITSEISKSNKYVFLGGSTSSNLEEGKPVLTAFSYDCDMKEYANLVLKGSKMKSIYKLQRLPGTDILVACGYQRMVIIEFLENEKKFVELKELKNIHSGDIFNIAIRGKDIFSVSPCDNYIHKF